MKRLIEKASVVFKDIDCGDRFEVLKTRDGQLTLGGKYSRDLVEFYAKTNEDVLVLDNGILDLSEEEPLKVGDYAKVVSIGGAGKFTEIGDIVHLTDETHGQFFFTNSRNGRRGNMKIERFSRATNEEVLEAKRKIVEIKRWAVIGRKPGEFKKGDAVRYKNAFTTVTESIPGLIRINQSNNVDKKIAVRPADLTLVFPVESRFE